MTPDLLEDCDGIVAAVQLNFWTDQDGRTKFPVMQQAPVCLLGRCAQPGPGSTPRPRSWRTAEGTAGARPGVNRLLS